MHNIASKKCYAHPWKIFFIAHQYTQEAPRLSWELHCSTLHPRSVSPILDIFSFIFFFKYIFIYFILLLTNTYKNRLTLCWESHCSTLHPRSATSVLGKYFYRSSIHSRSASPFLRNSIAHYCIQEALRPSLEICSPI